MPVTNASKPAMAKYEAASAAPHRENTKRSGELATGSPSPTAARLAGRPRQTNDVIAATASTCAALRIA
jgi:hypothetical protein